MLKSGLQLDPLLLPRTATAAYTRSVFCPANVKMFLILSYRYYVLQIRRETSSVKYQK